MQVLETRDLVAALGKRLRDAVEVDVAVAWARSGEALDLLQAAAKRGVAVRAIVGLSGSHTQPFALRTLAQIGTLRIADGLQGQTAPGGIFHPKIVVFRGRLGSVGWIGSANLTGGGFMKNLEVVGEFEPADALSEWFNRLWCGLPVDPSAALEKYATGWAPSRSDLGNRPLVETGTKKPRELSVRPSLRSETFTSWAAYRAALDQADEHWRWWSRDNANVPRFSVTGENYSWLDTIEVVGSLIRRPGWGVLPDQERRILLGLGQKGGEWGLLGSMAGAGDAKQIFRGNTLEHRALLQRVHSALNTFIAATGTQASINAAIDCFGVITQQKGLSHGVATRLMACARPDIAVSVNAGSSQGLGNLADLPRTAAALGRPENYRKLLQWIAGQPWHMAPMPRDPWGARLWRARAALLDCLVYDPQRG